MVGSPSFLSDNVPPMGIYETLYAFADEFGAFMGTAGTHPWSQGFPLTTPLDRFNGPELPASVEVTFEDRFYPKAWGHPLLRQALDSQEEATAVHTPYARGAALTTLCGQAHSRGCLLQLLGSM